MFSCELCIIPYENEKTVVLRVDCSDPTYQISKKSGRSAILQERDRQ